MNRHRQFLLIIVICLSLVAVSQALETGRQRAASTMPLVEPAADVAFTEGQLPPAPKGTASSPTTREDYDPYENLSATEQHLVRRAAAKNRLSEIGGNDLFIDEADDFHEAEIAIAENGDVFVALEYFIDAPTIGVYIKVFRSVDDGATFDLWSQIGSESESRKYLEDLDITTGTHARIFVTYTNVNTGGSSVIVATADPTATSPTWSSTLPLGSTYDTSDAELETDHRSWNDYYVYLVASGSDGNGDDIWYARSTSYGDDWESSYRIAEITTSPNRKYVDPEIAYGYGGIIHVAYTLTEWPFTTIDAGVLYKRAGDYGEDIGNWTGSSLIAPTDDDINQQVRAISASLATGDAVILYDDPYPDQFMRISADQGGTWSSVAPFAAPWDADGGDIEYVVETGQFVGTGVDGGPIDERVQVISRAAEGSLTSWSEPQEFSDETSGWLRFPRLALDPTRNERVAAVSVSGLSPERALFDAEWHGDPGYPNFEPGMPLDLGFEPLTPPVLVDIDDDGDLEILYSSGSLTLEARHHDGSYVDGWPVSLSAPGSRPAVGKLAGGELSIVVGTQNGWVYAFDTDGNPRPGWPLDMGTNAATYVSIGALGDIYPRTVVACSDDRMRFFNHLGEMPPNAPMLGVVGGGVVGPAAIGDLDNDGLAEAVFAAGTVVMAGHLGDDAAFLIRTVDSAVSDAITLGDLDVDGDLEIAVPTTDGKLYVFQHDGAILPGFPFDSLYDEPMTSAAWAQVEDDEAPDLAFGMRIWTVHLVGTNGLEYSGYPVEPGQFWYVDDEPVIGHVAGSESSVIIGSRDGQAYAWNGGANLHGGWPKPLGDGVQIGLSPAIADVDLDGRNEVVILGPDHLFVMDVGSAPLPANESWPMAGHDAQNTGCSDCPENIAVGVDDDLVAGHARIQFAGAFPNPVSGPATQFRFAVPVRAQASLDIFDIRGRRVRQVMRAEIASGEHTIGWNGRDGDGRQLASGQYLARLRVRGPGVREDLTRRVTVLR